MRLVKMVYLQLRSPIVILLLLLLLSDSRTASSHASSGVWRPRYMDHYCNDVGYSVHWPHPGTIPVRLNISAEHGVQRIFKVGGGTFSYAQVRTQLELALIEFNESLGVSFRLYVGPDTYNEIENGAIVISTMDDDPFAWVATGAPLGACGAPYNGHPLYGRVDVARYRLDGLPYLHSEYSNVDSSFQDFWLILTQELAHALGLQHTDNSTVVDTQTPPVPYAATEAIMFGTPLTNQRHWTKYERETFIYAHNYRIGTAKSYVGTGSGWFFSSSGNGSYLEPQIRSGRITEGHGGVSRAFVEWTGNSPPNYPFLDGMVRFSSGSTSAYAPYPPSTYSPPAIAVDEANADWRLFYLTPDPMTPSGTGVKPYGSAYKSICWDSSTNGYGWAHSPTCLTNPSNGQPLKTRADAVTVSFDRYRKVFIVLWIDELDYVIKMLTIPGVGSAQSAPVYSTFGHKSWEAPTVSCRHTQPGCVMVFMAYAPTGYLKTLKGDITSSGVWSGTDNWSDFYDLDQSQTPSIAYRVHNDSFVLTYVTRDMKTIRSYRRYWNDTVHWHTPLTVYTSSTSVSAPAVGTWGASTKTSRFVVTFLEYPQ